MTSALWRAVFTNGREVAFDVEELRFRGEPSLWRAMTVGGRPCTSPERAATDWADFLCSQMPLDGDHATGLREVVPPGQPTRAEIAAALDSARAAMTTAPQDWSLARRDAWLYGVVVGWGDALAVVAHQHQWEPEDVARLRAFEATVRALRGPKLPLE